MEYLGIVRVLFDGVKHGFDRLRLRTTLGPSAGGYSVWLKEATRPEPQTVTIAVRGDLFIIEMNFSSVARGRASAKIEVSCKTLEGQGTYEHVVPGYEPMFGTWQLKVRNSDTLYVTTRYAVSGVAEEVQAHVWRRIT